MTWDPVISLLKTLRWTPSPSKCPSTEFKAFLGLAPASSHSPSLHTITPHELSAFLSSQAFTLSLVPLLRVPFSSPLLLPGDATYPQGPVKCLPSLCDGSTLCLFLALETSVSSILFFQSANHVSFIFKSPVPSLEPES